MSESVDDAEVRCEDPGCRFLVEGGGTEVDRVSGPLAGLPVATGGERAGEEGGLDLSRRDMSSLAVVMVKGA